MARFDLERLVEGFRRIGGDDVAELARRDYRGDDVTDAEWASVFAAFGPQVLALHGPDRSTVSAGASTTTSITSQPPISARPTGPPAFDVLDTRPAHEPMGTLRAAIDQAGLELLWSHIQFDGPAPTVDFGESVVVSITIPDDACPPDLSAFDRAGAVVTPVFIEPATACRDPLIPKTFVVAIDRLAVAPLFELRLPEDPTYGFDEQLLLVHAPVNPTRAGNAIIDVKLSAVGGPAPGAPRPTAGVVSLHRDGQVGPAGRCALVRNVRGDRSARRLRADGNVRERALLPSRQRDRAA